MGDFDYLPEDRWPAADAYQGGQPPAGWRQDPGQPPYAPPRMNGTSSRLLSNGPRPQEYPPADGRTWDYPPADGGRPPSGYARPDSGAMPAYRPADSGPMPGYRPSGAMPAYRPADSGPMPGYRPSGPMPAYQPPDGRTRGYPRPDSGAFPAYVQPNGGGGTNGYPLLADQSAPSYPPPPPPPPAAYRPADSGPMPAYQSVNGWPVQGYPRAYDQLAPEFPLAATRVADDFPRADYSATSQFPRAATRVADDFPLADDRVASEFPRPSRASGRAAVSPPPMAGKPIMGWLPFGNRLVLLPRDTRFDDGDQEVREHRDISGGWLRPAVFGAMDGLVTNASLIAGVGGGGSGHGAIVLTGIAGLIAGAFSMATGEYISVTSQNDLTKAEVEIERLQHRRDPEAKRARLTEIYTEKGVSPNLAEAVVRQISADEDRAVDAHVREELGIDPEDLPSPRTAATASFAAFTVGALLPLSPFLLGFPILSVALVVSGLAAFVGGAALAKLTGTSAFLGGLRQFTAAFLATGAAFAIGHLISGHVM
jgi:vacuolar iron transporter family protein